MPDTKEINQKNKKGNDDLKGGPKKLLQPIPKKLTYTGTDPCN